MSDDVVAIFLLALLGVTLTLGAWFVRGLSRARVTTMFGQWSRADSPGAYWFWAVYHVAGLVLVCVTAVAVALYFVLSVIG
jgi:regulator of protease activity HflC (stomatin/prohibitin superfamily)